MSSDLGIQNNIDLVLDMALLKRETWEVYQGLPIVLVRPPHRSQHIRAVVIEACGNEIEVSKKEALRAVVDWYKQEHGSEPNVMHLGVVQGRN